MSETENAEEALTRSREKTAEVLSRPEVKANPAASPPTSAIDGGAVSPTYESRFLAAAAHVKALMAPQA